MPTADTEYYRNRAIEERQKAQEGDNADVAAIHLELAGQYEALVQDEGLRPALPLGWGNMPQG